MTVTKKRNLWDKAWNDEDGRLTIWQTPNIPLITWLLASVGLRLFRNGTLHALLDVVAFGSIFTWSYLEIRLGTSYFRKILGLTVMAAIILNRV
ncbi:MAG: hypothetical protein V4702_03415 [Patescibacteria group bacterium]